MAHYALLNENNIVVNVLTGLDEDQLIEGLDPETWYGNFHGLVCKRTSYNTYMGEHKDAKESFRKNYAQIGYTYDEERDAFIPPKPFNSWILDEEKCWWKSPVPYPDFDPENPKNYIWNEDIINWEEVSE